MKINFITLFIATIATVSAHINFVSNFVGQKVKQVYNDDPLSVPVIVKSNIEKKYHQGAANKYHIQKHHLKDSQYTPTMSDLSGEEAIAYYQDRPDNSFFDVDKVTLQDYQILQLRPFTIVLTNPTQLYKFCITDIMLDTDNIIQTVYNEPPFCIIPSTRYPFSFHLHLTQYKSIKNNVFKGSIYFFVDLHLKEDDSFVASKVWTKDVIAKVRQNFLKLGPLQARNCGKNYTTLNIANHQPHHIKVNFDLGEDTPQKAAMRQVMIPSQKSFKMTLMPKQKIVSISARTFQKGDIRYPKLFMPIYCYDLLRIDSYQIGILNSERSILEYPILISSNSKQKLEILTIQAYSQSQTIQALPVQGTSSELQPGRIHKLIGKLILHVNGKVIGKSKVQIKILYVQPSNPKQILQTSQDFFYYQYKNPLTFGSKRFINTKQKIIARKSTDPTKKSLDNLFTIKNNLNIPLQLVNVIADNDFFKVTWLTDYRQYIYPNNQRDQILIEYIGPLNLTISPIKYTVTLQFNGKIYVPVQFIIYDETLQCVYNNIQQKCGNIPPIDYGYFNSDNTKSKQLVIRNWNPTSLQLEVDLIDNIILQYGMNFTITIFGPFPNYSMPNHRVNNTIHYYLKGGHFIIINFAITPLQNATSGSTGFSLRTPYQTISSQIKFSVQNATIALIPQVLRINSAYKKTVEYLNLVSTYSEPYKIKGTSVNISNIHIYAKNDTFIYENQWIGLAIVFEPFILNITESCCGVDFAVNSFINSLYLSDHRKPIYALVRIQTSTDLEVNSTVIIDSNIPKLIQQSNLTVRLMQSKSFSQANILIKNVFSEPIKFSVVLTPDYLYKDAKQYMLTLRRLRKQKNDAMFCVNNGITVRHNFSPQMVKTLFNLESSPQQVTIQPLQNSEYYVDSQRKSFQGKSKHFSKYVINTVNEGARICYNFSTSRYIQQLIETKILNDLAQNHSHQIFLQFVEKQMQFNNMPFYFLENDQFYHSLSIDFQEYCKNSLYPLFRFCKQVNLIVNPKQDIVLQPEQQTNITLEKTMSHSREEQYSFYLTLLNNITKFESHYTHVTIKEPKLSLQKLYTDQLNYISKQYLNQKAFKERDWIRILGKNNFNYQQDLKQLKKMKKNTLPILLEQHQLNNNSYDGYRTFTIKNQGDIDIQFSHIGIDSHEYQCKNRYVQVLDICNKSSQQVEQNERQQPEFTLRSRQEKNISVRFSIPQSDYSIAPKISSIYLYYKKYYHFKIQLALKMPQMQSISQQNYSPIFSLIFNLISLCFIIFVISLRRKQTQNSNNQQQPTERVKCKTKIISQQHYGQLGIRLQKKKRKLDIFIDEEILALKQHQSKKLKDFFNSSCQSQIQKKYTGNQQQNSNNNILHDLKQQQPMGNSGILSQQSSLQYIDYNNRSNQNIGYSSQNVQGDEQSDPESMPQVEDSLFEEGIVPQEDRIKADFGWGTQTQNKNKKEKDQKSYYNVFLSQNPLKKQSKDPFHWMQSNNQQW